MSTDVRISAKQYESLRYCVEQYRHMQADRALPAHLRESRAARKNYKRASHVVRAIAPLVSADAPATTDVPTEMPPAVFAELLGAVREGGRILRGELHPSREFMSTDAGDVVPVYPPGFVMVDDPMIRPGAIVGDPIIQNAVDCVDISPYREDER